MLRHLSILVVAGMIGLSGCADSAPVASNSTTSGSSARAATAPQNTETAPGLDASTNSSGPSSSAANAPEEGAADKPANAQPHGDTGVASEAAPTAQNPANVTQTEEPPLQAAQRLFNAGNLDGALEVVEKAATPDSEDRQVLLAAAQLNQMKGLQRVQGNDKSGYDWFKKAGSHARQFLKLEKNAPDQLKAMLAGVLYNEACAFSVGGDNVQAKSSLKEALDAGFADFATVKKDPDLLTLLEDAEVQETIAAAERTFMERETAAVKQLLADFESFDFKFSLPDLEGKAISLTDMAGKVVVADIWGTWCPPCREEIPHFVALQEKYREQGLSIVGINYERGDPQEAVKLISDFARDYKMNYPCVIGDEQTRAQVPSFEGYPTTLFIDRTGKVRLSVVGLQPYSRLEAVITTLLAEKAPMTE